MWMWQSCSINNKGCLTFSLHTLCSKHHYVLICFSWIYVQVTDTTLSPGQARAWEILMRTLKILLGRINQGIVAEVEAVKRTMNQMNHLVNMCKYWIKRFHETIPYIRAFQPAARETGVKILCWLRGLFLAKSLKSSPHKAFYHRAIFAHGGYFVKIGG